MQLLNECRQTAYYDVAILVVDAITYGSRVRRVCLPSTPSDSTERYDGEAAEIMGEVKKYSLFKTMLRHVFRASFRMGWSRKEQENSSKITEARHA